MERLNMSKIHSNSDILTISYVYIVIFIMIIRKNMEKSWLIFALSWYNKYNISIFRNICIQLQILGENSCNRLILLVNY